MRSHVMVCHLRRAVFLAVCLGTLIPHAAMSAAAERPYRISDQFAVVAFARTTHSSDGSSVAFTRSRTGPDERVNDVDNAHQHDDVWLQVAPDQPARNLTNGAADGSGWWRPDWSPDGAWLTMFSSRGGTVTLWGWERATNRLRQISALGVDFHYNGYQGACRWADVRHLLCVTMADRQARPPLGGGSYYSGTYIAQAEAAWARAKRGEVTANVADSLAYPMPRRVLSLIDIRDGRSTPVVDTQAAPPGPGHEETFWPTREGRAVVHIRPEFASAFSEIVRRRIGYPADIDVRRLDGTLVTLDRPLPKNVVTGSIQWSPDGKEFAFFALEDRHVHPELIYGPAASSVRYPEVASKDYPGRLFRVNVTTGHVAALGTGEIDLGQDMLPPDYAWLPSGALAVHATRLADRAALDGRAERQWIVLEREGRIRPLVDTSLASYRLVGTDITDNGSTIAWVDGGGAMLGLARGDLWRIDPATAATTNLTASLDLPVVAVRRVDEDGRSPFVIITAGAARTAREQRNLYAVELGLGVSRLALPFASQYLLNVRTGAMTPITTPHKEAAIASIAADGRDLVFTATLKDGTFLWRSSGGGTARQLAAANQFWTTLARPDERIIEYRSLNGELLKAKLSLPPGYQPGRRYPIVVDSDLDSRPRAGAVQFEPTDAEAPIFARPSDEGVFTSGGYIYMWVSLATTTGMDNIGRGNLLSYTQGLLPALEAAVAQGYADPQRAFLYGMSSMGFGVYGIVTQTSRFTAAAGGFGWSDQSMKVLAMDMRRRYSETPNPYGIFFAQYLDGEFRTWRDGDVLRRNSPLTYVDRVQTPLLMIDSDFDAGWMENSELFYAALVQQRKPAKFVHYFGENHMVNSPANLLDMYQRIFAWFDQWGDITRDAKGNLTFEGDRVRSRNGAPPLRPEDYKTFDVFGPGGEQGHAPAPSAAPAG